VRLSRATLERRGSGERSASPSHPSLLPLAGVVGQSSGGAVATGSPPTRGVWAACLGVLFRRLWRPDDGGTRQRSCCVWWILRLLPPWRVVGVPGQWPVLGLGDGGQRGRIGQRVRRLCRCSFPLCGAPASMVLGGAVVFDLVWLHVVWCFWLGSTSSPFLAVWWWSVLWLRGSSPLYSAISLQRVAVGAGRCHGFAVVATVVTSFPCGGPSWLGVEPLCLAISRRGRCFRLFWCAPWL
jgi:hypothetical protein